MSDTITQTRLSLRLDAYLHIHAGKHTPKDLLTSTNWDTAWKAAEMARTRQTLTPELVDNVRIALDKF